MKEYRPEIAYQIFLLLDASIIAAFAATILHYIGEASDFAKISLPYGNVTQSGLKFDAVGCATVNFHIVLVTLISALIASIPMILVSHGWIYNNLKLDVKKYTIFPIGGIILHLLYVGFQYFTNWKDFGCLTWLNIF